MGVGEREKKARKKSIKEGVEDGLDGLTGLWGYDKACASSSAAIPRNSHDFVSALGGDMANPFDPDLLAAAGSR